MELSNIMEQFSGLSEITGEYTDRNVEDILREAEELLDMTSSVKEISEEIALDTSKISQSVDLNDNSQSGVEECASVETKIKEIENEIPDSPKQQLSARIRSPGSINHIKSTIDSLKEYSKMMENQSNSKSDDVVQKKVSNLELVAENKTSKFKTIKVPEKPEKLKKVSMPAFQRLSKNLPSRPCFDKSKEVEKLNKTANVRKTFNDLKSRSSITASKSKVQSKSVVEKKKNNVVLSGTKSASYVDIEDKDNELNLQECIALLDREISPRTNTQDKFHSNYPHLAGNFREELGRMSKNMTNIIHNNLLKNC